MQFLFHSHGLGFCAVAEHDKVVGVTHVEEITLPFFSPFGSLPFRELQVIGFQIPIEFVKVYVGQ